MIVHEVRVRNDGSDSARTRLVDTLSTCRPDVILFGAPREAWSNVYVLYSFLRERTIYSAVRDTIATDLLYLTIGRRATGDELETY